MLWGDCRCSRANRMTGAALSSEIRAGIASGAPDSRCSTRPRLVRCRAPQAPGKPPRLPNAYFPFDVGHVAFMVGHSLWSRGPLWGRRPRRPARAVLDADSVVPAAGRGRPGPEGTPTRGAAPPMPRHSHSLVKKGGIGQWWLPRDLSDGHGHGCLAGGATDGHLHREIGRAHV